MIIVRVELKSAITGLTRELARMHISNVGGTDKIGDYSARTLRGRSTFALNKGITQRGVTILGYPRLSKHIWNLVARALNKMEYK